jgi:hypothetical protein
MRYALKMKLGMLVGAVVALAFLFVTQGCAGGGTSGTGGGPNSSVQLMGVLTSPQAGPLSGIAVTAQSAAISKSAVVSDTAVTDAQGRFTVSVDLAAGETPKLLFVGPKVNTSYQVATLPANAAIVILQLTFDEEKSELSEDSVKFENENGEEVN